MIEGKIENSGIGVFPHSFGFFRFAEQISLLVGILLLKKRGKGKHAHTRLNGKIGKQDLGMEGGEETLRARERRMLWRCALWYIFRAVSCFCQFLFVLLWRNLRFDVVYALIKIVR